MRTWTAISNKNKIFAVAKSLFSKLKARKTHRLFGLTFMVSFLKLIFTMTETNTLTLAQKNLPTERASSRKPYLRKKWTRCWILQTVSSLAKKAMASTSTFTLTT
jgi:hypothetical protein